MFSSLQPNIPRDSLIKSTDTDTDKKHNDIESAARATDDSLDFDIQESVSKLESDIMKTVENNNNKLKELEHMLNEEKKSKQFAVKVVEEDDVVPIVETISDDDILEVATKPTSAEKVEEDYVVEDVSLLKKLIAETAKEDGIVETVDNSESVETVATPVDVVTTEKQIVETSTENTTPSTTVALVTTVATTIKVRLFAPEVSLFFG